MNSFRKLAICAKPKCWRLTRAFCFALLLSSAQILLACAAEPPSQYKGRTIAPVMSAAGADWLKREERERLEQPDKVVEALEIQPGMTVADVGAGIGYFSWRMARRVSSEGRVLAVDIQPEMLDQLKRELSQREIKNVVPILGTPEDPKLPTNSVDLALMVDVYHELRYPEAMVARIRASLKKDGRMVLVEYRGEDPTVPIKPEHKMTVKQVLKEILPMGFQLQKKLDFLPWQHIFIFSKDSSPAGAASD